MARHFAAALAIAVALAPAARADGPRPPTPTATTADESPALRFVRSLAASLPAGDLVKEHGEPRLLSPSELAATRRASFAKGSPSAPALREAASLAVAETFDPELPLALVLALRFADAPAAERARDELDRASIPEYTDVFAAGPLVVVVTTTAPVTGASQARISRQARAVLESLMGVERKKP
jgi:hypothetical protein